MSIKTSIACFLLLLALPAARGAEKTSQTVSLTDLPATVQTQIKNQLRDGALDEIEREDQNGEISYTVSFTRKNGEESYFTVGEEGSLLAIEVPLKELPANVQQAIKTGVGPGTLASIEKTFEDGEISYDINFSRKDGKERSFTLDSNGALTSVQLGLEEVPAPVRKVIEDHSAQGQAGDIFKLIENGEISYSAELQHEGKSREIVAAADGKLESLQKFLNELPEPARKTIREKAGSGKILRIDKSFTRI